MDYFVYSQHYFVYNLFVQYTQSDLPPLRPLCGEADLGTLTTRPPHLTSICLIKTVPKNKVSKKRSRSVFGIQIRIHTGKNTRVISRQRCTIQDKNSQFRDSTPSKFLSVPFFVSFQKRFLYEIYFLYNLFSHFSILIT